MIERYTNKHWHCKKCHKPTVWFTSDETLDGAYGKDCKQKQPDPKEELYQERVEQWRQNPGSIIDSDGYVWDTGADHY